MAKNYHIIHKRSSISGNTPNPNILDYGEIAVNYAANNEKLLIRNSSNTIAIFPEQSWVSTQVSNAIASAATSANTLNTKIGTEVSNAMSSAATSANTLNTKIGTEVANAILSAATSANTLNTKIGTEVGNAIASAATSANTLNNAITSEVSTRTEEFETLDAAKNDLQSRVLVIETILREHDWLD